MVLAVIRRIWCIDLTLVVYALQAGLSSVGLVENIRKMMVAANDSLTSNGVLLKWFVSR